MLAFGFSVSVISGWLQRQIYLFALSLRFSKLISVFVALRSLMLDLALPFQLWADLSQF